MNVVIVIAEEEGESSEAFPYHIVSGVGLHETEPGTERENWQEETQEKKKYLPPFHLTVWRMESSSCLIQFYAKG